MFLAGMLGAGGNRRRLGQRPGLTPENGNQAFAEPPAALLVEVKEPAEVFGQIDHVVLLKIALECLRVGVLLARPLQWESFAFADVLAARQ